MGAEIPELADVTELLDLLGVIGILLLQASGVERVRRLLGGGVLGVPFGPQGKGRIREDLGLSGGHVEEGGAGLVKPHAVIGLVDLPDLGGGGRVEEALDLLFDCGVEAALGVSGGLRLLLVVVSVCVIAWDVYLDLLLLGMVLSGSLKTASLSLLLTIDNDHLTYTVQCTHFPSSLVRHTSPQLPRRSVVSFNSKELICMITEYKLKKEVLTVIRLTLIIKIPQ